MPCCAWVPHTDSPPVESLAEVLLVVSREMPGQSMLRRAERRSSCRPDNKRDVIFTESWESAATPTRKRSKQPSERWPDNITQVRCNLCVCVCVFDGYWCLEFRALCFVFSVCAKNKDTHLRVCLLPIHYFIDKNIFFSVLYLKTQMPTPERTQPNNSKRSIAPTRS